MLWTPAPARHKNWGIKLKSEGGSGNHQTGKRFINTKVVRAEIWNYCFNILRIYWYFLSIWYKGRTLLKIRQLRQETWGERVQEMHENGLESNQGCCSHLRDPSIVFLCLFWLFEFDAKKSIMFDDCDGRSCLVSAQLGLESQMCRFEARGHEKKTQVDVDTDDSAHRYFPLHTQLGNSIDIFTFSQSGKSIKLQLYFRAVSANEREKCKLSGGFLVSFSSFWFSSTLRFVRISS